MLSKFWTRIARHTFGNQPSLAAPTARHDDPNSNSEKHDPPVEAVRSLSTQPMHAGKVLVMPAHEVARSQLGVQAMYEEAVFVYEQAWGPKHTLTLDAVNNLGLFYAGQYRTGNAEALLKRTVDGREGIYGPEHPLSLDAANNLGRLYQKHGRLNEAEIMYRKVLQGYTKTLGAEHMATLNTASSLAELYVGQGRLKHGERMYARVLRSKEKTLDPDHVSTLEAVGNLGYLYASQGRLGNAEAMYQRALRGYEVAFGPQHTSTLETVHNLGFIYQIQGRLSDAEAMYMRALGGYEKLFGKTRLAIYPPAVSTLECLANLLYELNRIEESRHYILCAESGHEVIFGQLHQRYEKIFTTSGRSPKGALLQTSISSGTSIGS